MKRGQFSLMIESSALTRLTGTKPKMLSISCKTFELRVSKSEYYDSFRKNIPNQSHLPFLQLCVCCVSACELCKM